MTTPKPTKYRPVPLGHIRRVRNATPKLNAAPVYYVAWFLDTNRTDYLPLIMTEAELDGALHRAGQNPEDMPPLRRSLPWASIAYAFAFLVAWAIVTVSLVLGGVL